MRDKFFIYHIVLIMITVSSCNNSVKKPGSDSTIEKISKPEYAERFLIEKLEDYSRLVIINPWQGATDVTQEYYLIKKGSPLPAGIDINKVIFTPVEKIICLSTTHIAMISALHSESTIAAISGAGYIYNNEIRNAAETGVIKDIGYEDNLNNELILELAPDIVMVYGIGSESAGYLGKLSELGVKVLFNADYLETDPLGKAEWIKVIGALYCKEVEADSIFNNASSEYNLLKTFISANTENKPKVLLGLPWKDTWFVSPGNSYVSKLINDAGGNYLWNETESDISMPYGLENVFIKALNADYWLNIGTVNSRQEIAGTDKRFEELPAYKNDMVYNNNKRINEEGGNDYWESGSIQPQIVLHDLAVILHPELFSDKDLFYYKKLN